MSGSTFTGLPGAPEVYASAQRTAHFPTAKLISLAGAEDDGAGTGSSSSPATTSPWPAPARVHPNIPLFRGAHAGSTEVLATKGSGKTPTVYAGVASAVAFMGPKRRRPPVFYFSSMMAVDAEALATDSSLSVHPASVAGCMAWPPIWESRAQKRETRYEAAAWTAATTPVRHFSSSWPGAASC